MLKKILKMIYRNYLGETSQKIGACTGVFFALPFAFHQFSIIGGVAWFLLGIIITISAIVFVDKRKIKGKN